MKTSNFNLLPNLAALTLSAFAGFACSGKQHSVDGDSGAAAPATVRDMSATPQAPDSTRGVSQPSGQPGAAGDTSGSRARSPKGTKP